MTKKRPTKKRPVKQATAAPATSEPQLIRTQAEFDAALKRGDDIYLAAEADVTVSSTASPFIIVNAGQPRVEAWGSSQPRVEAWGSSQPRVEAWESSQPRVVAWESSQPRVEAWGSSQPRVEARGSSQPRVVAWESSQPRVEARGYVSLAVLGWVAVEATDQVSVLAEGELPVISGGIVRRLLVKTAQDWCDYYGARVTDGVALLYKAVNDDYRSPHGVLYAPGTTPEAADWDDGQAECGGGLHFCATVGAARGYNAGGTRFMACPVALADMRAPQPVDEMPNKIKARRIAGPIVEVDEDGEPISQPLVAAVA